MVELKHIVILRIIRKEDKSIISERDMATLSEEENVEIRLHNVIYKMVRRNWNCNERYVSTEYHEVITGQAEIRQVIKASKVGNIAGCYVTDGYN